MTIVRPEPVDVFVVVVLAFKYWDET